MANQIPFQSSKLVKKSSKLSQNDASLSERTCFFLRFYLAKTACRAQVERSPSRQYRHVACQLDRKRSEPGTKSPFTNCFACYPVEVISKMSACAKPSASPFIVQNKYVMLGATSRLKGEKDWLKYETARCVLILEDGWGLSSYFTLGRSCRYNCLSTKTVL